MLCGWRLKENKEWVHVLAVDAAIVAIVPESIIQSKENTNRRKADAITFTANRQSEDEETRVMVIRLSSCPSAQAPVLLGMGDRMKHCSLAPGQNSTHVPHQDQASHSVTRPPPTHSAAIVSNSATSDTIVCPVRKQWGSSWYVCVHVWVCESETNWRYSWHVVGQAGQNYESQNAPFIQRERTALANKKHGLANGADDA